MKSIDNLIGWWNTTVEKKIQNTKKHTFMSTSLGFSSPDSNLSKSNVISSLIEDQSNRIKELAFPQKMIEL